MTFYKDEKKRLGQLVYVFIAAALLLHYGDIQGQIPLPGLRDPGDGIKVIEFTNSFFICTCLFLPIYLNEKLFFLKERGEMVYLISKYALVPLTKKELYTAKIRILIERLLLFFAAAVAVYFAVLAANDYWLLNEKVWLSICKGFLWLSVLSFLTTFFYIGKGIRTEKSGAY